MDRGAYSELNQNDVPVELEAENVPLAESSAQYPSDRGKRIDYVLVYETCKEKEEEDEDAKEEAAKLARLRRFYEKRLQKKGLILQHERIVAEQVNVLSLLSYLCCAIDLLASNHIRSGKSKASAYLRNVSN